MQMAGQAVTSELRNQQKLCLRIPQLARMEAHTCNPSTQEADTRDLHQVQGHPRSDHVSKKKNAIRQPNKKGPVIVLIVNLVGIREMGLWAWWVILIN